jgi:hypothetical protein
MQPSINDAQCLLRKGGEKAAAVTSEVGFHFLDPE